MLICLTCAGADNYVEYFKRLQYGVNPFKCKDYIYNVKLAQLLVFLDSIKSDDCNKNVNCLLETLNCK